MIHHALRPFPRTDTEVPLKSPFEDRTPDTGQRGLYSAVCDYSGATTSSHTGNSAHTPSVPSFFSYSTRIHASEISSPHSGQRPSDDSSAFMERGGRSV